MTDHLAHLPSPRPATAPAPAHLSDSRLLQLLHEQREATDRRRLTALLATAPAAAAVAV